MSKGRILKKIIRDVLIIVVILISIFPIIWIFLNAIKTNAQTIEIPPVWVFKPDWSHFLNLILSDQFNLRLAMLNSTVVALSTTGMALLIGFPCAYSISRFKTGGRNFAMWIISFRMLPPVIFMIPMFIIFLSLKLLDTHIGLAFLYLIFTLPLVIWVLKSFIDEIPKEFEEAAMIDGCSATSIMWRIVFPIAMPGIVSVAILSFFFSFTEFFFAYVFTSASAITMPAMAAIFITQYTWLWADLSASIVLTMIPLAIFLALIQKELVRGLTMGAIKG